MSHLFLAKAFRGLHLPALSARFERAGFTFVDIGGRGQPVRELRLLAPFANYVTCEPDLDEAARLSDSKDGQLWHHFKVVPAAIAARTGTATLYLTRKAGMSSLLEPNRSVVEKFVRSARFGVVGSTQVAAVTLDEAAINYGFTDASFLKIDTQGTELEILRSGDRLLKSVVGVRVEVSFRAFYREQPLFGDVDAFLRDRGFELFLLNRTNLRHAPARPDVISRRVTVYGQALYFRDVAALDWPGRTRLLGLLLAFAYFDLAFLLAETAEEIADVERLAAFAADQARRNAPEANGLGAEAFRDQDLDL
jgi:FkbM family methyltransferase